MLKVHINANMPIVRVLKDDGPPSKVYIVSDKEKSPDKHYMKQII